MKKIILIAALFTVSASAAFSQNIEWGAKAGLNFATQTKTVGHKMRTGPYLGVFAEYLVNDFLGVQGELLYSGMGTKVKQNGASVVYRSNYLTLPVVAKLYVAPRLSIDLGPQFGYMVAATAGDLKVYDSMDNKFDVSFAAGLSYKIGGRFDVSARYNLGLTRIVKDAQSKNSVIALGVGYRF